MNKKDKDAFDAFINKVTNGRPHGVNRLDLHIKTWEAALKYERERMKEDEDKTYGPCTWSDGHE